MAKKKEKPNPAATVKAKEVIPLPVTENKPEKRRPDAIPDELIGQALYASKGKLAIASETLGIALSTLHARIQKTPFLQEIIAHSKELLLDKAERNLHMIVEEKMEFPAICFFLKTRGKSRGYEETPSLVISPDHDKKFEGLMNSLKEIQSSISSSKIESISDDTELSSD